MKGNLYYCTVEMSLLRSAKSSEVLREALATFSGRVTQICRCTCPPSHWRRFGFLFGAQKSFLWSYLCCASAKTQWGHANHPLYLCIYPVQAQALHSASWHFSGSCHDCHSLLTIKMAAGPFLPVFFPGPCLIILPPVSKQRSNTKGPPYSHPHAQQVG